MVQYSSFVLDPSHTQLTESKHPQTQVKMAEFFGPIREFMEERIPNRVNLSAIKNAVQNATGLGADNNNKRRGDDGDNDDDDGSSSAFLRELNSESSSGRQDRSDSSRTEGEDSKALLSSPPTQLSRSLPSLTSSRDDRSMGDGRQQLGRESDWIKDWVSMDD